MTTKLIKLEDGTLIEVEASIDEAQPLAGGLAKKVSASVDNLKPILLNICHPITAVWHELNKDMHIDQAEVELGLSFEGSGNIYVTKSTMGANLTVKLVLKPKD